MQIYKHLVIFQNNYVKKRLIDFFAVIIAKNINYLKGFRFAQNKTYLCREDMKSNA